MKFSLGAFAIILDDADRVLLCHRTDMDLWNLPGGGVEAGESPWEACVREAREEVGLEVEVERLAGIYAKPEQDVVAFSFVCRVVGGVISCTDEADDVRFFSTDEIPSNTSPRQVERIGDALQRLDRPVMKTQTGMPSEEMLKRGLLA